MCSRRTAIGGHIVSPRDDLFYNDQGEISLTIGKAVRTENTRVTDGQTDTVHCMQRDY